MLEREPSSDLLAYLRANVEMWVPALLKPLIESPPAADILSLEITDFSETAAA